MKYAVVFVVTFVLAAIIASLPARSAASGEDKWICTGEFECRPPEGNAVAVILCSAGGAGSQSVCGGACPDATWKVAKSSCSWKKVEQP